MSRNTLPTQEEALKSRLVARFGAALLRDGYTAVPNLLLKRCRRVGMTANEFFFWQTVVKFQHDESLPWPSIERIKDDMAKSYRTVERYIKSLEIKELLRVERSGPNELGTTTNRYDFSPLYEKIIALDTIDENTSKDLTNRNHNAASALHASGVPDTFVGGTPDFTSQNSSTNGHQNGHLTTNLPSDLTAKGADKEDESQEDISQEGDSNLRSASAQTEKGTASNGSSTSSKQAGDDTVNQNGSSTQTNQVTNNKRKRKNENPPAEEVPAPPAWSGVQPGGDTPPPPLPMYAASVIDDISRQFHDQAPKSSQTIAARMYQELQAYRGDEYTFGEIAGFAKDDANKASIKKRNPDGTINRMPYFFKMLRQHLDNNLAEWAEEDRRRAEEAGQAGENKEETS